MKFILVISVAFFATISAEKHLKTLQGKRELNFAATDKQPAAVPLQYTSDAANLFKVGPQSFGQKAQTVPSQDLSYNSQFSFNPQAFLLPQGVKYAQAPPPHVTFGFAPQPQPQQVEYSQPIAYQPQPVAKVATAPSKIQASAAPAPASALPAVNFSPASEVSSFKFSSPLVTYSNLGVLSQLTGKLAAASQPAAAPVSHAASHAPAAPQAHQQLSYQPAPQRVAYAAAPAPHQVAYSAPQYAFLAAVPQKGNSQLAVAPQHQQIAYAAPQKLVYAAQPAAAPSKVVYAAAPQQIAYSPQQFAYAAPAQQQLAYSVGSSQGAHSVPQPSYSSPSQFQYSVPAKYTASSNNYGQ